MQGWLKGGLLLVAGGILTLPLGAADWPCWLGPNHNGVSTETGLLTTWPSTGPKLLWKVPGGDGYSAVAVAGGRAVTLVQRKGEELVIALDPASGKELWSTTVAPGYKNSYGNGPRSTPTIDGSFIYVQSVSGPLVCLQADSGKIVWQTHLLKEFGAKNISWGLSASPLVDGDLVYALPGAAGAGMAAFDKKTGNLVWKTGDDKAAYATPVAATIGGKKQIIFFTAVGLVGVTSDKGKELWRMPWTTEFDVNIATPLVLGDHLFVASGEGVGSAMLQLMPGGPPKTVWESKGKGGVMTSYWANAVPFEGHLYGLSGEFDKRIDLNCVEIKTGKLKWSRKAFGKGALIIADGHLFITTKTGDLVLARATPEKYEEKARLKVLGDNRTIPTIADKRLYIRDKENVLCLDVAK